MEPAGGGTGAAATELYGAILSPALADMTGAVRSCTVSMIYRLSIPRRYTDVTPIRMPELALDNRDRDPFARHLDCVGMPQLMWS